MFMFHWGIVKTTRMKMYVSFIEWIINLVLAFARTNQFLPSICRNIKLVLDFKRRQTSSFIRPISPLVRLMCQSTCCDVMSMCHLVLHMYKDHFDGNVTNFTFNFLLLFFLFYPSFTPLLPIIPSSHFIQKHQTSPRLFSFPLKPSSSSSLQNHHHLHRSTLENIPFCLCLFD